MVIPAMDHIDEHLAMAVLESKQSKQHSRWGKEPSTGIMTKPTILRSSVLPWVCFAFITSILSHNILSSSSSTQARLLHKGQMGGGLDQEQKNWFVRNSSGCISL